MIITIAVTIAQEGTDPSGLRVTLHILYGFWFPGNQERKYFAKLGDSASNLFLFIFPIL